MNRFDYLLEWVAQRRKAVVAAVVALVVLRLTRDGMTMSPESVDVLTTVVTAVSVYLVPNKGR